VRFLLLVFLATFSIAFVKTQSRSGLIALGVASVVAVVVAGPVRGRLLAIVLVVAAIGLLYYVYAAPPALRARVTSITAGAGTASPLREDTWQIALRAAGDHPVLGVGLGNFPAIESRYFISNLNIVEVRSLRHDQLVVHNAYLEVLAELGVVGALLFIAVLASTFGRAAVSLGRIERKDGRMGLLARALTASTVGLLTAYVFNSGEYEKQLWLILGMLTAAALLGRQPVTERLRARRLGTNELAHAPVA
jgi:O-antigen ligase